MEREILEKLMGKRIKISCVFTNSTHQIFYIGVIKELGNTSMIFTDRYDGEVSLDIDVVKEAKEVGSNG